MRNWIRLVEQKGMKVPHTLYHGTNRDSVASIVKVGLHRKYDQSYREFGQGIYLTDNEATAHGYGQAVLAIDVSQLDLRLMRPDDYELSDFFDGAMEEPVEDQLRQLGFDPDGAPSGIYECSWLDSLVIVAQCQYLGDIPASAIRMTDYE